MKSEKFMEEKLSEVLDNLLGMLLLEGSYEVEEADEGFLVSIETKDAGRLIGARGESLEGLQLVINQIMSRKSGEDPPDNGFKRVMLDVAGWRKQREAELKSLARSLGKQVLESKSELELEPMSPWQRRVVHMVIGETEGLASESVGEGRDRHVVIKLSPRASGDARHGEATPKADEAGKTEEQNVETGKS